MSVHPRNDQEKKRLFETFRASLALLAFGLFILAYLVAIDRPEWFRLRPITGTATAMAQAAAPAAEAREAQH